MFYTFFFYSHSQKYQGLKKNAFSKLVILSRMKALTWLKQAIRPW